MFNSKDSGFPRHNGVGILNPLLVISKISHYDCVAFNRIEMKLKTLLLAGIFGIAFLITPFAHAVSQPTDVVRIEVFERDDCGHCKDEKEFLFHVSWFIR